MLLLLIFWLILGLVLRLILRLVLGLILHGGRRSDGSAEGLGLRAHLLLLLLLLLLLQLLLLKLLLLEQLLLLLSGGHGQADAGLLIAEEAGAFALFAAGTDATCSFGSAFACVDDAVFVRSEINHSRRNEDQQLGIGILLRFVALERSEQRDVRDAGSAVERSHDLRIVELSEDKVEVVICQQKPEIIPLGLT